ncbi:MAG: TonB-dependent receptor [Bacteroidetes bacterium]|nr:MAG: TonB-dependent receptor [Bacteroidota bacterium]
MKYSTILLRIKSWAIGGLLFSVLCTGILQPTYAQKLIITDDKDQKRVSDVAVFNKQQNVSEMSNEKGVVELRSFNDHDTLVFQHPAYVDLYFTKPQLSSINYKLYMTMEVQMLGEVVMSATKSSEKRRDVPVRMEIIRSADMEFLNPQTSADMLQKTGNISVQKSQAGGGSPNLRGFEANKVLLVVDGVRMNNAIYRSGHLQNVITIDQASLERTEVIFGPGSVIYGSDAMGGVIHFYTKRPKLAKTDTVLSSKINGSIRYSSANKEQTTHFGFQVGFKKLAFLTSLTHNYFGDVRMGSIRSSAYPEFGKSPYYAGITEIGTDTMVATEDPNLQLNTGYRQINLLQKVYYKASPQLDFELNIQYSSSSEISRFDKLNDVVGDTLKYAEWYYGPQDRLLSAFTTRIKSNSGLFDNAAFILAYQKIDEDRITRKFMDTTRTIRQERVGVYSLNMDFNKKLDSSKSLVYGVEAVINDVTSSAYAEDVKSGNRSAATTRYPDGGSMQQQYAAYFNYKWEINQKMIWSAGVRYNQILMQLRFMDTSTYSLPFQEINENNNALNGSTGLVLRPIDNLQFNLVLATGFRAPNVDDMGKVFAKNEYVTVPNASLEPEYIYSAELGIAASLFDHKVAVNLNGFYSYLTNAIVQREYQLNGQDSLMYDGELLKIVANTNVGQAEVYGLSGEIELKLMEALNFKSSLTYTHGEDKVNNVPLSHIPPAFGRTIISHKVSKGKYLRPLELSIYSYYAVWKNVSEYGSASVDNLEEATTDGTPAWYTLNFSSSYTLKLRKEYGQERLDFGLEPSKRIIVFQISIENLLDQHYKTFSSGVSAPGRNFILSLNAYF